MAPGGVARPAAAWWLGILSGLVLCGAAAYGPALLPPGLAWARVLGVRLFGSVSGIRVVFWLAQVAHAFEAAIAWRKASKHDPRNVWGWTLQTALLGYPSLKLLAAATKTNRAQGGSIAPLELDTVDVSDTEEEEEHAGQKAHQGRRKAKKPRAQRLKGQPAAQDKSRKHTG